MASGSGTELIVTGSDDGTVKVWESSTDDGGVGKHPVTTIDIGCPVTGVCWSKDGQNVYVAALDNEIHVRLLPPDILSFHLERGFPLYFIS